MSAGVGADRTRRTTKAWAVTFGLFFVLLLLFFAGFGVLGALGWLSLRSGLALAAVFVVGLVAVMVVSFRVLWEAHHPRVYREARDRGLPASATVLDLDKTGWRTGGGLDLRFRTRRKRYEYALRLRVAHPAVGEFEARTTAYLTGDEIPQVGDGVRVKVHPQRPDVVVMDLPQ